MSDNPQLKALALFKAYHDEDNDTFNYILADTDPLVLNTGIVLVTLGAFATIAASHGMTVDEVIALFQNGVLAALA